MMDKDTAAELIQVLSIMEIPISAQQARMLYSEANIPVPDYLIPLPIKLIRDGIIPASTDYVMENFIEPLNSEVKISLYNRKKIF